MSEVIYTIQNLGTNEEGYISDRELEIIRANKEEAAAYFHLRLDQMQLQDKDISLDNSQLLNDTMFGLFFLAEWKDTSAFAKVGAILHKLGEDDDGWLGDIVTENLPHIQYQIFDGNYQLLTKFLYDLDISTFARLTYATILIQEYLDGRISLDKLLSIVRYFNTTQDEDIDYYLITFICDYMMKAHVKEFLPDVRNWIDRGWVDTGVVGNYTEHFDVCYHYKKDSVLRTNYSLKKEAGYWFRFENNKTKTMNDAMAAIDKKKEMDYLMKREADPYKGIGRNDPCPCGSGKKFKKCCLPILEKVKAGNMEPLLSRLKKTEDYPELSFDPVTGLSNDGFKKIPGRLYLEDDYDKDAITIDYYLYLAKKTRDRRSLKEMSAGKTQKKIIDEQKKLLVTTYYEKAEELRAKKIAQENISGCDAFDQKYSIHFLNRDWDQIIAGI